MPLLICALFFAALFTFEIAWYYAGVAEQEQEVDRYEHVEHPRRPTSDRYLDVLLDFDAQFRYTGKVARPFAGVMEWQT